MTSHRHTKKILLVNPWIHDFAAYDYWAKPLGLLYIGSFLRNEGFRVELVDCLNDPEALCFGTRKNGRGRFRKEEISKPAALNHIPRRYSRYGMSPRRFREALQRCDRPDAVLVTSVMTYWYPGVFEAIGIIKELFPDVPLALGGIYATLCPEHARAHSGADLVVEGDVLFREPGDKKSLRAVLETLFGVDLDFFKPYNTLDSLPFPAYDLLPSFDQAVLLTSRGCPYSCDYCASRYLDGFFQERDPLSVADEIEYWIDSYGVRDFSFYDDALIVNAEKRLVPLLEEIMRRGFSCRFHCPNGMHLRGMNDALARLMYRAGFKTLRFGFETSQADRQKATGDKISNPETAEAVRHLKRAGFRGEDIGLYLLCGLPGQNRKEMEDTVDYVASLGVRPVITEYSPIPHTPLWPSALASSNLDLAGEPLYHNNSIFPCLPDSDDVQFLRSLKVRARASHSREQD